MEMALWKESGSPASLNHGKSPSTLSGEAPEVGGNGTRLLQAYEFFLGGQESVSPAAGGEQRRIFLPLSHSQSTPAPHNGGEDEWQANMAANFGD